MFIQFPVHCTVPHELCHTDYFVYIYVYVCVRVCVYISSNYVYPNVLECHLNNIQIFSSHHTKTHHGFITNKKLNTAPEASTALLLRSVQQTHDCALWAEGKFLTATANCVFMCLFVPYRCKTS